MPKLLYLSCHAVLEYDEVSLFHELGIAVFSPGAYVEPANPGNSSLRPAIPTLSYSHDDLDLWNRLGAPNKERLTKEYVDRFDAVMVMHMPEWIEKNWHAMKHKPVIWRTIGQCLPPQELQMRPYREQGLRIVRYSPRERTLGGYAGEDAVVRFYKDPEIFKGWTGGGEVVMTASQSMPKRGEHCGYQIFLQVSLPFHRELYGPGNEEAGGINQGQVSMDGLIYAMQSRRAYFYTGTWPACYTLNFIEAWMTGIPVVAIGPYHGNAPFHWRPTHVGASHTQGLYEIQDLIENGVNGYCSDHITELQDFVRDLMQDYTLARKISISGRESAIHHFGKANIKNQWRSFFRDQLGWKDLK